jgi:hypothetical protein
MGVNYAHNFGTFSSLLRTGVAEGYSRHKLLSSSSVRVVRNISLRVYTLGNLGWRYSPSEKLMIVSHAAWMREKFDNYNPQLQVFGPGAAGW